MNDLAIEIIQFFLTIFSGWLIGYRYGFKRSSNFLDGARWLYGQALTWGHYATWSSSSPNSPTITIATYPARMIDVDHLKIIIEEKAK